MGEKIERQLSAKKEWVEIFPYGVSFGADEARPIMIFKDKDEKKVLPVWMSPLNAGIALQQESNSYSSISSPYALMWDILKPLGIELSKCYFVEVKGHHQFVELHFTGHPKLQQLKARADESVSFCLSSKAQFFCRSDFFKKSRVLDAEMIAAKKTIHPGVYNNKHPYLN